jgi:hypothetical protein
MTKQLAATSLVIALLSGSSAFADQNYQKFQNMLDLSGIAWLENDRFLVVHDAKNPKELKRTRISFLKPPSDDKHHQKPYLQVLPLDVVFPDGQSSDLESASRVPGEDFVILAESGDSGHGNFHRVFLARFDENTVTISDFVDWKTFYKEIHNVEATAVAKTSDGYRFIWAERNSGKQETTIHWSEVILSDLESSKPSLSIGDPLGSASFSLPGSMTDNNNKPLYNRSIVGMDVDDLGNIYTIAAHDPEGSKTTDADNGPFRSVLFKTGYMDEKGDVVVLDSPEIVGKIDGLKAEGISYSGPEAGRLFFGTDDENYGGTLRGVTR